MAIRSGPLEQTLEDRRVNIVSDATTPTGSPPPRNLAGSQDAYFGTRAASWTDRYQSSPSFRSRLYVVGQAIDELRHDCPQARVLDFGGGTGVFSAVASRWASFTACVDRSLPMLTKGRADLPSMAAMLASEGFEGPLGKIVWIAGDDQCVGSLRASFDLILAIAVLEYVADAKTLLTRLTQRLDQRGMLLITVPNRTSPVRIAQRIGQPLVTRRLTTTGRLTDLSFLRLRPHGDDVPWQLAAAAAGLVVEKKTAVPLGLSGVRRWFHPTLLISLRRPVDHRG